MTEPLVGAVGLELVVRFYRDVVDVAAGTTTRTVRDISSATSKQILLRIHNGATTALDGAFDTDGTDGLLKYVTVAGTFTAKGRWSIQGVVTLASGEVLKTPPVEFQVGDNLA